MPSLRSVRTTSLEVKNLLSEMVNRHEDLYKYNSRGVWVASATSRPGWG
jgi:hypothetical protein